MYLKTYHGGDYDKIDEVLSILEKKKLKINNIIIEKFKGMLHNLDFKQDYWSRTAKGIYKKGNDSTRLSKWLIYYDNSYYDNMNYFD